MSKTQLVTLVITLSVASACSRTPDYAMYNPVMFNPDTLIPVISLDD